MGGSFKQGSDYQYNNRGRNKVESETQTSAACPLAVAALQAKLRAHACAVFFSRRTQLERGVRDAVVDAVEVRVAADELALPQARVRLHLRNCPR